MSNQHLTGTVEKTAFVDGEPRKTLLNVLTCLRELLRQIDAGVLGDGPAVLAGQLSEHPEHEPADSAAGLDTGEPGGHPIEQPVGLRVPPPGIYAVAHGHRLII